MCKVLENNRQCIIVEERKFENFVKSINVSVVLVRLN